MQLILILKISVTRPWSVYQPLEMGHCLVYLKKGLVFCRTTILSASWLNSIISLKKNFLLNCMVSLVKWLWYTLPAMQSLLFTFYNNAKKIIVTVLAGRSASVCVKVYNGFIYLFIHTYEVVLCLLAVLQTGPPDLVEYLVLLLLFYSTPSEDGAWRDNMKP